MDLQSLRIFVKVAELASFTRASEQLGLPKARVSTAVQALESRIATRLLHRTTRSVRLTPDGEQFLERSKALLADAEQLHSMFQQGPSALRGRLRVDLPSSMARDHVIPRLPEFLAAHPQIEIALSTTDRRVDPVLEGFDCVLRVGSLPDSGLVARTLGHLCMANCASPAYLSAHGVPQSLADLDRHRLIHYSPSLVAEPPGWEYREGGQTRLKAMRGVITVNSTDAYQAACLAGLGLIQAPRIGMRRQLALGTLVEVMPAFPAEPMPVSLRYPDRRNLAKRVQALMSWLAQILAPHLDGPAGRA